MSDCFDRTYALSRPIEILILNISDENFKYLDEALQIDLKATTNFQELIPLLFIDLKKLGIFIKHFGIFVTIDGGNLLHWAAYHNKPTVANFILEKLPTNCYNFFTDVWEGFYLKYNHYIDRNGQIRDVAPNLIYTPWCIANMCSPEIDRLIRRYCFEHQIPAL